MKILPFILLLPTLAFAQPTTLTVTDAGINGQCDGSLTVDGMAGHSLSQFTYDWTGPGGSTFTTPGPTAMAYETDFEFPNIPAYNIANSIAHEIGHQFGLAHGEACPSSGVGTTCRRVGTKDCINEYPNVGLMSSGSNSASDLTIIDYFIPRHLNLIRCRVSSPGR